MELLGAEELVTQPVRVTLFCDLDVPLELLSTDGVSQLLLVDPSVPREYSAAEDTLGGERKPSGRTKFSSRFDAVSPGEYFLSGNYPPVAIKVHVGISDMRVSQRIEDCGTVRLRSGDGAGLRPDQLEWSVYAPDGTNSLPMPASFDKDTKEWIVRAPVGRVDLLATCAKPATTGQQEIVVAPGETRSDLNVVWESRTPIRLRDAGVPALQSSDWWGAAVVTSAEGALLGATPTRTNVYGFSDGEIYLGHAGDVIQLPAPPGYEKPGPIRIPEGGFPKGGSVTVNLVRRKM
jgi:hypothetical protein